MSDDDEYLLADPAMPDIVFAHRLGELLAAGYPLEDAELLAARRDIDLHQAVALLGAGCPHGLAVDILI